jgi:hypothetical protein
VGAAHASVDENYKADFSPEKRLSFKKNEFLDVMARIIERKWGWSIFCA